MKHLFAYEMSKLASLWMEYKFMDEVHHLQMKYYLCYTVPERSEFS